MTNQILCSVRGSFFHTSISAPCTHRPHSHAQTTCTMQCTFGRSLCRNIEERHRFQVSGRLSPFVHHAWRSQYSGLVDVAGVMSKTKPGTKRKGTLPSSFPIQVRVETAPRIKLEKPLLTLSEKSRHQPRNAFWTLTLDPR